ncbi:MAG TPA: hypothetical protein VL993_05205 [Stellaceae bacterium]|nr:hypothetical protein [Stellaceae bacterium]
MAARLGLVAIIVLTLASCGGHPARSPYDGDCTEYTCNGHLLTY